LTDEYRAYSLSDPGHKRNNNEDCYLSAPKLGLWAVADGMGGHDAGEVASAIAIKVLHEHAAQHRALEDAIQLAHDAVIEAASMGLGAEGMGSTIVAVLSTPEQWHMAWVGDSRAYLWTSDHEGGHLQQISADHSYVQMLYESGAIDAEDMDQHPDKHVITQCLGMTQLPHVDVDTIDQAWEPNQILLLCSDGLSDELNDDAIAHILCKHKDTAAAAQALMQAALDSGGRDNITLQLIESPLENMDSSVSPTSNKLQPSSSSALTFPIALAGLITVAALALLWIAL